MIVLRTLPLLMQFESLMVVCSSNQVSSRVETIEEARKEYKKLIEEGWKKLIDSTVF